MARRRLSWLCAFAVPAFALACGGSSHHDSDGGGQAGQSAGAAGHGAGGKGGSSSGAAGVGGSAGGMRGGSAGSGDMQAAGHEEIGGGGSSAGNGGASGGRGGTPSQGGAGAGGQGGSISAGGAAGKVGAGGASGGRGGLGGSGGFSGAVTTELNAVLDTVAAYCTAVTACCQGTTVSQDACDAMYASNQPALGSLTNGSVTLDMTALATCKSAYGAGPDQCNLNAVVTACAGVYVGTRAAGEPCTNLFDCDRSQGAMSCVVLDPNTDPVGTCRTVPHLQNGDDCSFACRIGDDCSTTSFGSTDVLGLCFESDGLVCDYGSSKCQNMVALGSACTEDGQCGSEAYCDTTCKARPGVGEPCDSGASCRHELQCGDDGNCANPTWTSSSTCAGYAPAP